MPDDNSGENIEQNHVQKEADTKIFSPLPDSPHGPVAQPAATEEMQQEVRDIDNRVKRAERWMIGLTLAIAIFALGSVIVGILQWSAMSGQLGEMRSGGKDTHDLAIAAGKQADAAKIQADAVMLELRPVWREYYQT